MHKCKIDGFNKDFMKFINKSKYDDEICCFY